MGQRGLGWEIGLGLVCLTAHSCKRARSLEKLGAPRFSFHATQESADLTIGWPAPYCTGARTETPASFIASLFSTSLCRAGRGAPWAPTDPPKFTCILETRLPGGLRKGDPCVACACADRSGGGGDELHPRGAGRRGEGRTVGAGSEVWGWGGGCLSPPALGT